MSSYRLFTPATFSAPGVDYITAVYSTTLVPTAFCTGAIVYRIITTRGFPWYSRIIEIIIESALLYCVSTLLVLITYIIYSVTTLQYAVVFWEACTGIAPTLIVARIPAGQSVHKQKRPWDRSQSGQPALVSLPEAFRAPRDRSGTVTHTMNLESTIQPSFDEDISGGSGQVGEFRVQVLQTTEIV
ncbi:hypothetical protein H0H92_007475 [Tricholoma furcatifolium]|nr:hypothetical protein H0H92_007475 [Tricholoma furcatifolium]